MRSADDFQAVRTGGRRPIADARARRRAVADRAAREHSDGVGMGIGKSAAIALGVSAAALAALAAVVEREARRAERRHPPAGRFLDVDGVRLHYIDVGEGPPVVLLHGNASMLQDPCLGLLDLLAEEHRVIDFDRPGFGYSERPNDREWTPEAQADLIHDGLARLGVERPVLFGHSWGGSLVVTYALRYPDEISGVVAASGYYYPNRRLDAAVAMLNAAPLIGPIARHTLTPALTALTGDATVRLLFSPNPVPEAYEEFPASLAARPSQLRAAAEDGTYLRDWAMRTSPHYGEVSCPVMIVAGDGDKAVDHRGHSIRLHRDIPDSRLRIWPNVGHMVHHVRGEDVVDAIEEVFDMAAERHAVSSPAGQPQPAGPQPVAPPPP